MLPLVLLLVLMFIINAALMINTFRRMKRSSRKSDEQAGSSSIISSSGDQRQRVRLGQGGRGHGVDEPGLAPSTESEQVSRSVPGSAHSRPPPMQSSLVGAFCDGAGPQSSALVEDSESISLTALVEDSESISLTALVEDSERISWTDSTRISTDYDCTRISTDALPAQLPPVGVGAAQERSRSSKQRSLPPSTQPPPAKAAGRCGVGAAPASEEDALEGDLEVVEQRSMMKPSRHKGHASRTSTSVTAFDGTKPVRMPLAHALPAPQQCIRAVSGGAASAEAASGGAAVDSAVSAMADSDTARSRSAASGSAASGSAASGSAAPSRTISGSGRVNRVSQSVESFGSTRPVAMPSAHQLPAPGARASMATEAAASSCTQAPTPAPAVAAPTRRRMPTKVPALVSAPAAVGGDDGQEEAASAPTARGAARSRFQARKASATQRTSESLQDEIDADNQRSRMVEKAPSSRRPPVDQYL